MDHVGRPESGCIILANMSGKELDPSVVAHAAEILPGYGQDNLRVSRMHPQGTLQHVVMVEPYTVEAHLAARQFVHDVGLLIVEEHFKGVSGAPDSTAMEVADACWVLGVRARGEEAFGDHTDYIVMRSLGNPDAAVDMAVEVLDELRPLRGDDPAPRELLYELGIRTPLTRRPDEAFPNSRSRG